MAAPFPLASTKRKILLLIRGLVGRMVARLDATLGAIRGIGEGVAVQRERGAVQFVQFLCSQQMA